MRPDSRLFLADITRACERIIRHTKGMSYDDFLENELVYDAALHNLMVIGEAAKQIPAEVRANYPQIEWTRIARFRDIVVHHYFGLDNQILWGIVELRVPELFLALSSDSTEGSNTHFVA